MSKCEVIIPVGPGHEIQHEKAVESVRIAEAAKGPFQQIDISVINDTEGKLGRSRARNLVAEKSDADWIFFLDADDRLHPNAFDAVTGFTSEYDAIWGNIWELAGGVCAWRYQIPRIYSYRELISYDPYLTVQMGHFVKTEVARKNRFAEEMSCGEDWDYYLRVWQKHRCIKIDDCLFLNQRGMHSTGPRSASGGEWSRVVGELISEARHNELG